jgi:probable F420-dependent oxidoreductase
MQVGISIPSTEIGNDPIAIRDFMQAVEDMGYAHLTLIDHVMQSGTAVADDWRAFYTRDNPFHEPIVFYAYVAAITKKIELATAILILPQRPTALVAKQAAELDMLSGGRLRLGVGIGWNEMEFDVLEQNFRNRANRMVEQIAVMRALWTNELVTFKGKYHQIEDAGINPLPVQRPIPIWIGAFVEPAIKRAGRVADGWFTNPRVPPGPEAEQHFEFFRSAAEEAGRDPSKLGIDATVLTEDKGSQAWAAEADQWKEMGATHLTVRTMASGLASNDEHIETLRRFKEAYP